ncbi:MAG: pyruvate carboxylase [Propionibacterium sp.]|nr:MAG: pyruvate carboxylase [Propionibacterium sp.]
MFNKILIANRGEIAVRAMRAAHELGCQTVAVYAHEDRNADHRIKADESYLIGEKDHPVQAYLSIDDIIRVALRSGAEAVYPGYGFLSENPDFAAACTAAGLRFIGPRSDVIELAGNKVRALEQARLAGIPTLNSCEPTTDLDRLKEEAQRIGFPLFVKAVAGGGGRGMRRIASPDTFEADVTAAMREATGAFGDATVYLEQAVAKPRHIEVQILADEHGDAVHLYERDCSIQRRHQKVVEIAPAPGISDELRDTLTKHAISFVRTIGYSCAGTVEFLVETEGPRAGEPVFIEMNPRIQVEHTVTEEITDVDLVAAQIRIAAGETLAEMGLTQDNIHLRGSAIQCRITTEDPANSFRPDCGIITAYRSASGAGIRLDGGTVGTGVEISPHFDSMLVKVTARGRDLAKAVIRARRALQEFQIEGLATNIPFLSAVLAEPELAAGELSTAFIEQRPYLLGKQPLGDRGTRMLRWLASTTVNKPHGAAPTRFDPRLKLPAVEDESIPDGSRQLLREVGPAEFCAGLRRRSDVGITDTTFRNHALQMLLRGRNTVGYTPYPTEVTQAFVAEAVEVGLDIFRIFDALNDVEQMRPAIEAVLTDGRAIAQAALCYTGNLLDPAEDTYTLDYYLQLAERLASAGAHSFAIKDMAGLLRPAAARRLVTALRSNFDLPVHLHTHDTAGGQLATLLAAIESGVDGVDVASAPLSGTTSQPSMSALVMALQHTDHNAAIDPDQVLALEPYWEAVRKLYLPFESGLPSPTGRVYSHEIPGGQLSNLRQQAIALGLSDKFEQIELMYAAADKILGRPTKVTPSSKVVGDLALHLVAVGADPAEFAANPQAFDIPDSVIGFLFGELGEPAGGWPEPFRGKALAGRERPNRLTEVAPDDMARLTQPGRERQETLNRLLMPAPTQEYQRRQDEYGDVSVIPTASFLYGLESAQETVVELGEGTRMSFQLEAISDADARAERTVLCQLDGQLRSVKVRDLSLESNFVAAEKANPAIKGHVAAPFAGAVTVRVAEGDEVAAGDVVAGIEAMKMEANIAAPISGRVTSVVLPGTTQVEGGDLLCVIE